MNDDLALLESTAGDGAEASVDTGVSTAASADTGATPAVEGSPAAPDVDAGAEQQTAETPSYEVEYPEVDEEGSAEGEEAEESTGTTRPADQVDKAAATGSGRYGVAALDKLLKENEPLRQTLDANPRLRSHFFHLARRAEELEQFQTIIPTPARAREVAGKAQQLDGLDRLYYGDNPQEFLEHLREASYLRDPQNPDAYQLDPVTKQPISSGAYEKTAQFMNRTFLDALEQRAQAGGNENLIDAVKTIRDALRWSPSSPARDGQGRFRGNDNDDSLSPEIRQQLERGRSAERELEELRRRRSEEQGQSSQQFMSGVGAEVNQGLRDFVGGLLAKTAFSDYDRKKIAEDFVNEMSVLGDQDTVHSAALDDIFRQGGLTPQTRQKAVQLALSWARRNGAPVLEKIITEAGGSIRSAQAQRQAAQAQAAASRREPVSGGRPAAPQRLDLRQQVMNIQKETGRRLSDLEILNIE